MSIIYTDEILNEFAKLSEQQNDMLPESVEFDKSQFDLLPNINNDLNIDGPPVFVTAAIVANADDKKTILQKKYPLESEDLVEKAHPESVLVAEHPYGGLVENLNEQHQKMLNVVNKMPTGFPLHSWASIAEDLVKIAQECDDAGLTTYATAIDEVVESFFLKKSNRFKGLLDKFRRNKGKPDGEVVDLDAGAVAVAPWLVRMLATPVGGIIAGVLAGASLFWTVWDGIKEDISTDIQDLVDELDSYYQDPDFRQKAGLKQMYDASKKILIINNKLSQALADRAAASNDPNIAKLVADLYIDLGKELGTLEANFPIFEAQAPKNIVRKFVGFENLRGRIEDLRDLYEDLGKAADLTKATLGDTRQNELDKSVPSAPFSAPNVQGIKKWLQENDVSDIIGRKYTIDDTAELDDNTVQVLSDYAAAIRKQLGTNIPSTKDLMNTSYLGMESLWEVVSEPWKFVETK